MIDVVTPTLWRPLRLAAYVDNVHENTVTDHIVTFVAERDDKKTLAEVRRLAETDERVRLLVNDRKCSVLGAFNCAAVNVTAEWWFGSGDDVVFHHGWDRVLFDQIEPGIKVIGTNDLGNPNVLNGKTATHMLINTAYVLEHGGTLDLGPGVVCCEDYHHGFFDTELVEVAKQRGVWQPCLDSVVEHAHFAWGKAAYDETYLRNLQGEDRDWALWATRRQLLDNPQC